MVVDDGRQQAMSISDDKITELAAAAACHRATSTTMMELPPTAWRWRCVGGGAGRGAPLRFAPCFPARAGNVNSREISASSSAARCGGCRATCHVHQVPPRGCHATPAVVDKWPQFASIRARCTEVAFVGETPVVMGSSL